MYGGIATNDGDIAVGLPVLTDTAGVDQNIQVFNILSSLLIIVVIIATATSMACLDTTGHIHNPPLLINSKGKEDRAAC